MCVRVLLRKQYFSNFRKMSCVRNVRSLEYMPLYSLCVQCHWNLAVREFDMPWLLHCVHDAQPRFSLQHANTRTSRDRRLCSTAVTVKWIRVRILQRALVKVIYTSEKLYDVYDSYSRIIYSVWPWQGELREIYFSSFSWRDHRDVADKEDIAWRVFIETFVCIRRG